MVLDGFSGNGKLLERHSFFSKDSFNVLNRLCHQVPSVGLLIILRSCVVCHFNSLLFKVFVKLNFHWVFVSEGFLAEMSSSWLILDFFFAKILWVSLVIRGLLSMKLRLGLDLFLLNIWSLIVWLRQLGNWSLVELLVLLFFLVDDLLEVVFPLVVLSRHFIKENPEVGLHVLGNKWLESPVKKEEIEADGDQLLVVDWEVHLMPFFRLNVDLGRVSGHCCFQLRQIS